jgi:hypothetical protein
MVQEITAEDQVIDILRGAPMCDLDEVMRRCPTLTWNQMFLDLTDSVNYDRKTSSSGYAPPANPHWPSV